MTKSVNEYFFDKKSKEMYYVLGLAYGSYAPPLSHKDVVLFRDSHKKLIEIIKDALQSNHNIIPDNRGKSSYFFSFTSPYVKSKLKEIGLTQNKKKRSFPNNIPKKHLSHFVRGFFDTQGYIHVFQDLNRVHFNYYKNFLRELSKSLADNLDIKEANLDKIVGRQYCIVYGHRTSLKLYDFIYDDFDYVKTHNLFLPSKRNSFNLNHILERSQVGSKGGLHYKTTIKKIEKAKRLILKRDEKYGEFDNIATKIGYNNYSGFFGTFKSITGMSPRDFLKSQR